MSESSLLDYAYYMHWLEYEQKQIIFVDKLLS